MLWLHPNFRDNMKYSYRWAYRFALCLMLTPGLLAAQDLPVNTESAGARAHFIKGMDALDANRNDDARKHFEKAIEYDAGFAAAHLYRTWIATSGADWKKHHEASLASRDGASPYIQNLIDQNVANTANDTERTMRLAHELVVHYPSSARAYQYLGFELGGHKKFNEARAAYKTSIALDNGYAPAYRSMAMSYVFNEPKDLKKAEKYARKYVELVADEADAYIVLGDVIRAQGDFGGARDAYASAVEVDPANEIAHSKRGHANTYLGDYEAARADFSAAAEAASTLGGKVGQQQFGAYTYLYADNVDAAMQAMSRILDGIESQNASEEDITFPAMNTHAQIALIAMHNNRFDEANAHLTKRGEYLEKAIGQVQEPDWATNMRANLTLTRGLLAAYKGDTNTARKLADENKAMRADQTNPRRYEGYHRLMGVIEMKDGNHAAAVEHLLAANDQNPMVKYEKAMAQEMAGDMAAAKKLYKEVADYNFNSVNTALCRNMAKKKVAS